MTKFPSHLVTKRIQNEVLMDAATLAAETLPLLLPPEEAFLPLERGKMLTIRFDRERKQVDWLRVAFEDRHATTLENNTYRIAYDGACYRWPITKFVLAYSISPQVCAPFRNMVRAGLRQKEVELWVLEVAKLAELSHAWAPNLIKMHYAALAKSEIPGADRARNMS